MDQVTSGDSQQFASALEFFEKEYKLNHLLGTSQKPIISIMNGITSKFIFRNNKLD